MTAVSAARRVGHNSEESPCRVELAPVQPDGIRVIRLSGVPRMQDSRRVHEAMAAALREEPRAVVVDVSGVERLDGDGVMLLVRMRRQARRLGPTLPLAGAAPGVARALRRFDSNGLLHVYATVYEAIRVNAARVAGAARRESMVACAG